MKTRKLPVLFLLLPFFIGLLVFLYSKQFKTTVISEEQDTYLNIDLIENFPRTTGTVFTMALNDDKTILYIGGDFQSVFDGGGEKIERAYLAAIDTNTYEVLEEWEPTVNGSILTIATYGDDIYIGGEFSKVNGVEVGEFARIKSNGTLDDNCLPYIYNYNYGPPSSIYSIDVNDSYIYVGGEFDSINGEEHNVTGLVRLENKSNCSWDDTWTPTLDGATHVVKTHGDDIYIGGDFSNIDNIPTNGFARVNSNKEIDVECISSFNDIEFDFEEESFALGDVYSLEITDSDIYIGSGTSIGEAGILTKLKNNSSCTLDDEYTPLSTFDFMDGSNFPVPPLTISLLKNNLFIGGRFETVGEIDFLLSLYNDDDDTFSYLAPYIMGLSEFRLINGITGSPLNYWNPFILSIEYPSTVYTSITDDNTIYVGGHFNVIQGEEKSNLNLVAFTYSEEKVPTVEINSIEDLNSIRDSFSTPTNYVLTRDLDFNDCQSYDDCSNKRKYTGEGSWAPIGADLYDIFGDIKISRSFVGSFDGQGHEIRNLHINERNSTGGDYFYNLFGGGLFTVNSGQIKNLGITGNAIYENTSFVGGLTGINFGEINNSYSTVDIVSSNEEGFILGGLVGFNFSNTGTISNSYSTGTITGQSNSEENLSGGLVGLNAATASIINSYTTSFVNTQGDNIVTGGLVGNNENGKIIDSYWDINTSGQNSSSGGVGKTALEMKSISTFLPQWNISTFADFDSTTTWYIEEGKDYPKLYHQYRAPKVQTLVATELSSVSVTLKGEISNLEPNDIANVYFQYKQASEDEWINTPQKEKGSSETFDTSLTKLQPNTTYRYRAVLLWKQEKITYGDTLSFTTSPLQYKDIDTNINNITNLANTEKDLSFSKQDIGSITFSKGLNLLTHVEELLHLDEHLIVEYVPVRNIFKASVYSNGLSYLAQQPATIQFTNISQKFGINDLTSENFKERLYISVYDDNNNLVSDTTDYFDWNNVTYNSNTDTLTLPVNHFSTYELGANELAKTGTNVLPFTILTLLILIEILSLIARPNKKQLNE
ncbi:MAG: GLUG motif-containing protein [Candidatus Dojkabacteria bacterium]|jgi:hypothetical protein